MSVRVTWMDGNTQLCMSTPTGEFLLKLAEAEALYRQLGNMLPGCMPCAERWAEGRPPCPRHRPWQVGDKAMIDGYPVELVAQDKRTAGRWCVRFAVSGAIDVVWAHSLIRAEP